jgi:hypothetical protein
MKRGSWIDARAGMRGLLTSQLERIATAGGQEERSRAVNMLTALAAPWTRSDPEYEAEEEAIRARAPPPGRPWPDELRFEMVSAIVCCLARRGMLDTVEPPVDEHGFLDDEEEAAEAAQ